MVRIIFFLLLQPLPAGRRRIERRGGRGFEESAEAVMRDSFANTWETLKKGHQKKKIFFGNVKRVSTFAIPNRTRILKTTEAGNKNRRRAIRSQQMKRLI
ncbi:MAG: hypothetical protein EOP43_04490 [Sphingobacteriaceae bacterium]|nr:MAG: hypothetical protein EOP43_04490 [Sphingobacteriaceae bacterium]